MVMQHFMELLAGSKVLITLRASAGGSHLGPPARNPLARRLQQRQAQLIVARNDIAGGDVDQLLTLHV